MRKATRIAAACSLVACAGLVCLLPIPARADPQEDRIRSLEQRLDKSLKVIEELSSRLAELERAGKPAGPHVADTADAAAKANPDRQAQSIAGSQEEVRQISEGFSVRPFDFGLPIHGFADVLAAWSGGADPQKLRGFNAGTLDLYLTPEIGNRVRSLVEIAIEYDPDGSSTVDMERLQLGYTVSDALTVWMGRFHTPFGLWNTAFHHGANLQTSIFRPRFVDFEDKGGIIPAHSVGLWGTGKTELGPGKITYDAYVSNGPTIRGRQLDFNPFSDDGAGKMVGFNLGYMPSGLRGLTAGIHGFGTTVRSLSKADTPFARTRVRMGGAYAAYDADDWEVFAEYYRFSDTDLNKHKSDLLSTAWFVHAGRTFDRLTPFVRFERVSLNPDDNYFASQLTGRSYTRSVVGSRYAIDERSSVKFELSRTDEAGLTQLDENGTVLAAPRSRYNRASFQYSIAFLTQP